MVDEIKQCARVIGLAALTVALNGCAAAYFGTLNAGGDPDGVADHTIVYDATRDLRIDVYRPERAAKAPVVVFFHGGSWQNGQRDNYAFVARSLARRGMVAMVPDYRAYPAVHFPEIMEDPARAVAWVREHAGEFGGDARRIFVAGHSSGAHLIALLATDARYLARVGMKPRDLAGAIGVAGPYDFLPITDKKIADLFGTPEEWPASQPILFVDGDEPPFLVLHGARDRTVDPRNSARFAAKLRAARGRVTYRQYRKAGHVRIVTAFRVIRLAPTMQDVVAFVSSTPPTRRPSR
jgi:acetyl esterase/lipase